jgi:peroxiredoxin
MSVEPKVKDEVLSTEDADEIAADQIDGTLVPGLRSNVAGVEVEGESVLLVEGSFRVHWLNRQATLVLSCFDGTGTLDEVSNDLSHAFGVDVDVVRKDVIELSRQLGRAGLLEGVAEEEQAEAGERSGLEMGSEFPPFELPDLDGRPVSFEDLRGRPVLLLNWSPRCGYCARMAPELAELQPRLREQGVDLVLLAFGPADENRAMLEEHGLEARVLLHDGRAVEPFLGVGTPAAYLLDEEGKTASGLVVGALDVPVLARASAGGGNAPAE